MSRATPKYLLNTLLDVLESEGLLVAQRRAESNQTMTVTGIVDDSRRVITGSLFVAVQGEQADGHAYVGVAVESGASAVVVERLVTSITALDTPQILVTDSRRAVGVLAHAAAGSPSKALDLVGVTGTNGKTTTTWLIHHMFTSLGISSGLLGTIENRIGAVRKPATLTTPGPVELNALLAEMVEAGCTTSTMEVSSHALAQDRVAGLAFAVGVLTNMSRDHLDYHGSWTNYVDAKKRLFSSLDSNATAIVNTDDDVAPQMERVTAAKFSSFGTTGRPTYRFDIIDNQVGGLRLRIDGDVRRFRLAGQFNAYNLTAAYGVGRTLGYPAGTVLDALSSAPPVPGRLEQFIFDSGVTVFVDYAHTPDALLNALRAIKETAPAGSTIWCIFGCGGDRDPGKRPQMGHIAEANAERVIVTSDNPRTEAPEAILDDIRDGMARPEQAEWIVERRDAIRFAGHHVGPGDIVLVAGKGHEYYQVKGTERVPFDDGEEVRRWFN